jgi:hypothetical protein
MLDSEQGRGHVASARFPKFVNHRGILLNELRKAKGTSKLRFRVAFSI